ncbi:LPS export ABC transporter permease LptG [Phaeobacter gallaeciensis]|uniref:LPS export ABC transporter permease LptG n=1 Tax=Phaeobacter gallaeciensis TaxID=60890 RepID=UPI00237F7ADF|nr:LPS export ABC transporter permease LptG [Phaeobacter gallaeciensis]MDE4096126.1 LPS export ABC transporter permease LptG [Phaeobacter gallaeciensis]MDE4104937.1 LPS export ABC transporter permease LptG [Phaeobacter gallaeciensis]MDE4109393.1 LPS export ABC transporter permease LptG [Phaeobacter gallaeciensis]MDE4113861.1 LPS export ABC transporter permease LptG [Phaeobacter gallaeciensis]MDE4118328.1 LPS export ABC transporter permease LptG [Phaeobacter gallaeciensis]
MKLDLYYARRFAQWFLVIAGVLMTLVVLIDLNEQIRRFDSLDLGAGKLIGLTLLNAPAAFDEFLPLIMILSTIVLFVGLARSSELVVTRAIGRSGIRALAAPVLVAALIGILALSTLNPIVAATTNRFKTLSETYRNGGPSALSLSGEGLWLRQGSPQGQSVIHASGYAGEQQDSSLGNGDADSIKLFDISILDYAPGGTPIRQIVAESARLQGGDWLLTKAKVWPLAAGLNPETSSAEHEVLLVPTTLTTDRIRDTLGTADGISVYDLPATIRDLDEAGFSTKRYEVWYQAELARPLFLVAMVLVGAAFTMRHTRFGGTGLAVLTAVLLGFGLHFIRNFAQVLGENGQIPVALAAWAPPVAAILLTMGLLLHAEDG